MNVNVQYRILRHTQRLPNGETEVLLAVHEVYVDGQGRAYGKSPRPAELSVGGRGKLIPDLDVLRGIMTEMLRDIVRHPVQDANSIPEPGAEDPFRALTPKGPSDRIPTEPGRL
jgi:hypothetical protein